MRSKPTNVEYTPAALDSDKHLRAHHLGTDLKQRSIRGGVVTMTVQGFQFIMRFAGMVLLARLLTPEDYGLFAIVISVTSLVNLFKDLNLSLATIQRDEINQKQVSNLFWINAAAGCALALLTALAAPLIGWFYGDPRLTWMLSVIAMGYVFVGFTRQHQALLRRQMRFTALAVLEIVSMMGGTALGMVAAWYGMGFWSLVIMQLMTTVLEAAGIWAASGWRPGPPDRQTDVRSLLAFGGHITGTQTLNYLNRNADNLLIGWYWGARALGFYEKAYQLLLLPVLQISMPMGRVALPVLSRLQRDPGRFREYYIKSVLLAVSLGMPLIAFLFVTADQVIPLVLGSQWTPTVPIFRALALAAFLETFGAGTAWIFVSLGHSARQFRASLITTAITLAGFVVGVAWGPIGVALAYSMCRTLTLLPLLIYGCRGSSVRWTEIALTVSRPALAAAGAALGVALSSPWLAMNPNVLVALVQAGLMYCVLYLAIWIALPGGKQTFLELVRLVPVLWENRDTGLRMGYEGG